MAAATVSRKRPATERSNKKMFVVLGAVLLIAVVRFLLPALAGGGSAAPAPVVVQGRHLVKASSVAKGSSGPVVAVSRPTRNPFSPPAGYSTTPGA
jgi:hypothetical protein